MGYEQSVSSQKKLIGFVLVLLLHIVLIYALINGMAQDFVKKIINDPLEVNIIAEVKLPPPPPPPPKEEQVKPKEATPPPAYVPPVEVKVQANNSQDTITAVTSNEPPKSAPVAPPAPEPKVEAKPEPAPEPEPPPPPKPKERTKASTKPGCTKPPYPAESQELEEEGTVTLGITTDTDGNVVEIKIIKSSGFTRLDDAAKQAFGRCEFNPGTVDGVPEKTTATVQYEFRI